MVELRLGWGFDIMKNDVMGSVTPSVGNLRNDDDVKPKLVNMIREVSVPVSLSQRRKKIGTTAHAVLRKVSA